MLDLVGNLPNAKVPLFPSPIDKRVSVFANCLLSDRETFVFSTAFSAFAYYAKDHPMPFTGNANVFFVSGDSFCVSSSADELGNHLSAIVYWMDHIRAIQASEIPLAAFALEELFHCFYQIHDEIEVKETLLPVLNQISTIPVTLHDLYRLNVYSQP